ncbi:MAG: hypothetical protein KGL39_01095 [Patescibacteria group bacterium]|nr:hypothetical protein [Patescibacteria group bacterium]
MSLDATDEIVRFRVSGEPFDVKRSELDRFPSSFLTTAASFAKSAGNFNADGTIDVVVQRDVRGFRVVRHFMETGEALVPHDPIDKHLLVTESAFYGFDELVAKLMGQSRINSVESKSPSSDNAEFLASTYTKPAPPAWAKPSAEWITKHAANKKDEKTADRKVKPFFVQGKDAVMHKLDAVAHAKEHAARVAFGKDEDASPMIACDSKGFPDLSGTWDMPDYTYLTYPGRGRARAIPMVRTLDDFLLQNRALSMDLLRGALGTLPLVQAGGSVLAALHEWPACNISRTLASYSRDVFTNVALHCYYSPDGTIVRGERKNPPKKTIESSTDGVRKELSAVSFINGIRWRSGEAARLMGGYGLSVKGIVESAEFKRMRVKMTTQEIAKEYLDAKTKVDESIVQDWTNVLGYVNDDTVRKAPRASDIEQALNRVAVLESFRHSDIDLFLTTRDPTVAADTIVKFYNYIRAIIPAVYTIYIKRTKQAVTFVLPWPYRRIQIILRLYHSIEHVLAGFDIDCCAVGFDGTRVVALPRAIRAIRTRSNIVDQTRQSTTFEGRLAKYSERGFDVAIVGFDVAAGIANVNNAGSDLTLEERLVQMFMQRAERDSTRSWGPIVCDYDGERPCGIYRPRPRFSFGTDIHKVLTSAWVEYTGKFSKVSQKAQDVPEVIEFQKHMPHTQDRVDILYTGSFHPVTSSQTGCTKQATL